MTTKYGMPIIKLPGGEHIQIGRIVRFLAGIAVILALITGWLEWHDKTDSHNLLFVDGSVRFIRMKSRSGRTKDYTVYPFRDVNEFFDKR